MFAGAGGLREDLQEPNTAGSLQVRNSTVIYVT
jgi:hypothetical protein